MPFPKFTSSKKLAAKIDAYFASLESSAPSAGNVNRLKPGEKPKKPASENEPVTFTGLALFLGFASRDDFYQYAQKGKYATTLTQGLLRIETTYEKILHRQQCAGAMFALKNWGWRDKAPDNSPVEVCKNLNIQITEGGQLPVSNEGDVKE